MKRVRSLLPHVRRVWLMAFAIVFTSLSIAGQTYAIDEMFYSSNDIDFYDPSCAYTGSTTLSGNGIEEKIWNFLKGQGLSDQQAAGVMGNMEAESNFIPTRFQGDLAFNPWDSVSGHGWGLVQWDGGRRYTAPDKGVIGRLKKDQPNLAQYVDEQYDWAQKSSIQAKIPPADLDALLSFELNYMVQESKARPVTAQGFGNANNEWDTLKIQKTIDDATVFWHNNFEVSADSAATVLSVRGGFAKQVYDQFAGKTTTSTSSGSTSSDNGGSSQQPTVFLDPGHGGAIAPYTDPQSGFLTLETHNMPESADVLDVANRIQASLTQAGYHVVMSRTTNDQQVKFRDRADAAQNAGAAIGVSIHTTPGDVNQAWPQRVGTYREYNGNRETFTNATTAQKSELYANTIAKTRTIAENHNVTTDPGNTTEAGSFGRSDIPTKGNIPLVSLWSPNVPWVYNEIGQDQGTSISDKLKQEYADGITKGIEQALPYAAKDQCGNAAFTGGNLAQTIFAYAWPDYHAAVYIDKKPEYAAAVTRAVSQGRYVGGINYAGIDCGGFVTTAMVDSGFDPKYNHSGIIKQGAGYTVVQQQWLDQNWQKLGSATSIDTSKLQQGDVAISSDHTFIYAGTIPNFHSNVASASLDERAPMAGHEGLTMPGFTWYRKR